MPLASKDESLLMYSEDLEDPDDEVPEGEESENMS